MRKGINMGTRQEDFIKVVGALARNEYLHRNKWILPSVCIAQGALESGWNLNAKTLFGIKGKGFNSTTHEYVDGEYITVIDSFIEYPNIESAVIAYYDFLCNTPRYANCLNNANYKEVIYNLQHTTDGLAYATDIDYCEKVTSIIEKYNLTEYDKKEEIDDIYDLAMRTINGEFGNGEEREKALGQYYDEVQKEVNRILGSRPKAPEQLVDIDDLARRTIRGEFGNDQKRRKNLGNLYDEVQKRVNELL